MASRHRILVEGRDDQHVIRNLLREHGTDAKILEPHSRKSIRDAIAIERIELWSNGLVVGKHEYRSINLRHSWMLYRNWACRKAITRLPKM